MARYDDYGLLIDYKYCTNCRSCEVACQQEKGLASDQFGIRVFESKAERKGDVIDDAWDWAYVPMPTWRCDLCAERLDAGRKPMCVKHCLAACMQVGPMDELAERAKELGDKVVIFKPTGAKRVDIGNDFDIRISFRAAIYETAHTLCGVVRGKAFDDGYLCPYDASY